MLMLERLTPKERAAYLLHEIFDMTYPDIARTLKSRKPPAASWSRAHGPISIRPRSAMSPPRKTQEQLLAAFRDRHFNRQHGTARRVAVGRDRACCRQRRQGAAIGRILRGKEEVIDLRL